MTTTLPTELLRQKLLESLHQPSAVPLTARDIRLPAIPGKVLAVIGVRRGGKTSFLRQQASRQVAAGKPPASQLFLSLEDERLTGMTVGDLAWIVDEHGRLHPELLVPGGRALYLDEVQLVPGWELFVRRQVDAGMRALFVSGSSARLLSREVATSLRGRGMEVLVHPFSFRESLRHAGGEPERGWDTLPPDARLALDGALLRYMETGGFPEAQGAVARDRPRLLQGYIDSMLLRDVIDRHRVSNPTALLWLARALLAAPGGRFTVTKFRDTLRSQGVPVAKETLEAYLSHLDDAFLVRTIAMHATSERQRMVNPRKAYPVDPGSIALYARSGRSFRGASLETVVLLELERRGYTVHWVKVGDDREVDFLAERPGDLPLLVQVCLDAEDADTWTRETRALEAAAVSHPEARRLLITGRCTPPGRPLPAGVEWQAAAGWLLAE